MEAKNGSSQAGKYPLPPGRLSREEKIKILTAIQEFGFGMKADPTTPVKEMDHLYHLANSWKAELLRGMSSQKKDNVLFVSFGSMSE